MALVTVQRSPSPSNTPDSLSSELGEDVVDGCVDSEGSLRSPTRARSFSESYFAVKGAALILPQSQCQRQVTSSSQGGDIQNHLQSMFYLLRPQDTIKVAVKLESMHHGRHRYMALVSTQGRQDTEECIMLGIDITEGAATIGLVLNIWGDTSIHLDGDGGFKVKSNDKNHIFKPVSVQAMWSALQSIIKARDTAQVNTYYPGGLTHTWVTYYQVRLKSEQSCVNEWNMMDDMECLPDSIGTIVESDETAQIQRIIKTKLKEIMMTVDLEEVTSKYLRNRIEDDLGRNLKEYKQFIDEETIVIMRQMDSPSEIFSFLHLGSEWNASNLDELQENGVGYILNVTREIANFFPGMFAYKNVRLYDEESSELLKHWDSTYRFIQKAVHNNSKVLVHCKMGVSRSASTVIAYAMKEYGWSLDEAYDFVKKKRSCIKPNRGFMNQLVTYQGILDASKQRHSSLWRSISAGNLKDASLTRTHEEARQMTIMQDLASDPSVEASRPRSWSPEDNTTQLLLKARELASEDDSSDAETQMTTAEGGAEASLLDLDDQVPLLFTPWHDDSQSCDSLDEVLGEQSSPRAGFDGPRRQHVVFLSSKPRESCSSSDSDVEEMDTDSSDLEDFVAEEPSRPQRGFYDVQMLNMRLGCEVAEEGERPLHYLHPDVKIELIMAQLKKHRRTAQLLQLSQPPCPPEGLQEPPISRPEGADKESLVPPNTPLYTKLRADNSWIREIPPSPQQPVTEMQSPTTVTEADTDILIDVPPVQSEAVTPPELQLPDLTTPLYACPPQDPSASTAPNILPVPTASPQDISPSSEDNEVCLAETAAVLRRYKQEDIPWDLGRVKRHTQNLEDRFLQSGSGTSSPCGSLEGIDFSAYEPLQPEVELGMSPDGEQLPARPASIYESEAIELEPGIVQRTKQEIEEKHKSLLDLEDTKPVQRTSSLKTEKRRGTRKDRDSERRKTCQPLLSTSSSSSDVLGSPLSGPVAQGAGEEEGEEPLCTYQVGSEVLELEPGLVLKQKKDFEDRFPEQLAKSPSSDSEAVTSPTEVVSASRESQTIKRYQNISSEGRTRVGSDSRVRSTMSTEASDEDLSPQEPIFSASKTHQDQSVARSLTTDPKTKSPFENTPHSAFTKYDSLQCDRVAQGGEKTTMDTSDKDGGKQVLPPAADSSSMSSSQTYKEEAFPWSVGTVKQHKAAIESKATDGISPSEAKSPSESFAQTSPEAYPPSSTDLSYKERGKDVAQQSGVARGETQHRRLIIIEKNLEEKSSVVSSEPVVKSPLVQSSSFPGSAASVGRSASFKDKVPISRPGKRTVAAQNRFSAPPVTSLDLSATEGIEKSGQTIPPFMTPTPYGQRPKSLSSPPKHKSVSAPHTDAQRTSQKLPVQGVTSAQDINLCSPTQEGASQSSLAATSPDLTSDPTDDADKEVCVQDLVGIFEPTSLESPQSESGPPIPTLSPPRPAQTELSGKISPRMESQHPEGAQLLRSSSAKTESRVRPSSEVLKSPPEQLRSSVHLKLERQNSLPVKSASDASDKKPQARLLVSDFPRPNSASGVPGHHRTSSDKSGTQVQLVTSREPDHSEVPRRSRKLHGKTHPLARLSSEASGPGQGRSPNALYNTM